MQGRTRIGLYGGTFDPVHIGHTAVALGLLKLFSLERVVFIPAHVAPHKRELPVTPAFHRYAMLALATQEEPALCVSLVELNAPERPYTVETLTRIRESAGEAAQLFFIMGADSWSEISTWRESERVLGLSNHIVVTRPGYEWSTDHVAPSIGERVIDLRGSGIGETEQAIGERSNGIYLTDAVNMSVSATTIRDSVREGRESEWIGMVAPPVADYIRKYKLYGEA